MDRAHDWWSDTAAKWNEEKKNWTFPSGATITFAYMETDSHRYRYQGSEYNFVGFDELTHFSERQYSYLASRLRRKQGVTIPPRMRSASNPGGRGHEWVKQYFLVEGLSMGRPFIPARLDDNPFLDQDEYRRSLNLLDPITRQQLLSGNWNARHAGAIFNRDWFVPSEVPTQVERLARCWDLAAARPTSKNDDPDWTVGILLGRGMAREIYVLDVIRFRGTPGQVAETVAATAYGDGFDCEVYIEQEPGGAGVALIEQYQKLLARFHFRGIRPTGDKAVRAAPVATAAQNGEIRVCPGDWHGVFFDELEGFPEAAHDDQVDALSLGYLQLAMGGELRTANPGVRRLFSYV